MSGQPPSVGAWLHLIDSLARPEDVPDLPIPYVLNEGENDG